MTKYVMQATRHTPEAVVSFSTEKGDMTLRTRVNKEGTALDNQVLSISTTNDISADAGTFQITLTTENRWDQVLASNDLVKIYMRRDGTNLSDDETLVFVGLVDDVRKSVSIQGDTPQRSFVVTGRNFAKALINFEVGVIQEAPGVTSASVGWLMGRVNFAGSGADDIVGQLFDTLIYEYMDYEFFDGSSLKDLIQLSLTSREGEKLFDEKSFINYQGSMQSFIREVSNEPFNQIFWECYGDGKTTFNLRATPFNDKDWSQLVLHTITDELVLTDSIGRSDVETYSVFSVGMTSYFSNFDVNQSTGVLPLWYEPYFKKFGLRRLHRYTGYAGYGSTEDSTLSGDDLKAYQEDLFNWNIHNPSFYNGFIIVRGDHRYKVGDRLLYVSDEDNRALEFFIESVDQDFTNFGVWTTKLGVTRGLPDYGKDRFAEPWGKFEEYKGGALGDPIITGTEVGTATGTDIMAGGTATGKASSIIEYAKSWIGRSKYIWGGGRNQSDINAGRFDCSSFVHHVFKHNGITLGSGIQTSYLAQQGKAVSSASNLQPGDLVFWNCGRRNGHVGIYIGDNKWIGCQGSPTNTKPGVQIVSINDSWWRKQGLGSLRRVL